MQINVIFITDFSALIKFLKNRTVLLKSHSNWACKCVEHTNTNTHIYKYINIYIYIYI